MNKFLKYLLICVVAAVCCTACKHQEEEDKVSFENFDEAYKKLCDVYSDNTDTLDWITLHNVYEGQIFVDTENKLLIFKEKENVDSIHFDSVYQKYSVKTCEDNDNEKFEKVLTDKFGFPKESLANLKAAEINQSLNAEVDSTYLDEIESANIGGVDKALSVFYNACVGDAKKHIMVTYSNHKMSFVRDENFPHCFIDKLLFAKTYQEIYYSTKSMQEIDSLLRARRCIIERKNLVDKFTYYNVRTDKIYIGDREYGFKESYVKSLKDSIIANPTTVYLFSPDEKILRLEHVVPEYGKLDACSIAPIVISQNDAEIQPSPIVLPNWLIGVLCILLGFIMGGAMGFILHKRIAKNKLNQNVESPHEKVIFQIEELIKILENPDKSEISDEKIDSLVCDIKKDLPEFDYKNVSDLNVLLKKLKSTDCQNSSKEQDACDSIFKGLSSKSSIKDILTCFDKVYKTTKSEELSLFEGYKVFYTNIEKEAKKEKCTVEKFFASLMENKKEYLQLQKAILAAKSEADLLNVLKKKYPEIALSDSISQLYNDAVYSSTSIEKQIEFIIDKIEENIEIKERKMSSCLSVHIKQSQSYVQAKKYLNLREGQLVHEFVANAVNAFVNGGQTITSAVEFVEKFKPEKGHFKARDEIMGYYSKIDKTIQQFKNTINTINQKETLDYWDRLALIVWSISKCVIPVLDAVGCSGVINKQKDKILSCIKNDVLLAYITLYFLRDSQIKEVDGSTFYKDVLGYLNGAVNKYNKEIVHNDTDVAIPFVDIEAVVKHVDIFKDSINKIRQSESMQAFTDLMWDNFVQDFLSKAPNSSDAYIWEQALNIAYHTVDFVDYIKRNKEVDYCYNYKFLLNKFDVGATGCREFIYNDYSKSSPYSNRIYELAQGQDIDHLKILIDNYLIKP